MSEDEDDPEEKVGPTVRYLQKLGADHLEVILDASTWVFEQDKEAGLQVRPASLRSVCSPLTPSLCAQIFIADLEEVETLPRHAVMAHLDKVGRDVCSRYLEHIIDVLDEQGADFHEKLIELYLAEVQSSASGELRPCPHAA